MIKRKVKNKKKSKIRDEKRILYECKESLKSRIKFLPSTGYPISEIGARKDETSILLKILNKYIERTDQITKISTVYGIKFSIGDKFYIRDDKKRVAYKIRMFPTQVSMLGDSVKCPIKGRPYTCEVYIGNVIKIKKKK